MHPIRSLIDLITNASQESSPRSVLREYLDIQHYQQLFQGNLVPLYEDRMEFLYKTYGLKLNAKWTGSTEAADIIQAVNSQPGEEIAAKIIAYVSTFDPSTNGQFIQWLITRYLQNGLRLEDLEVAKDSLQSFLQMKGQRQLPPNRTDINQYRTLHDLSSIVLTTHQTKSNADAAEEAAMRAQTNTLYDGPDMRIFTLKTKDAACYFGRNTEWCTAWGGPKGRHPTRSNRFSSYAPDGPLFVIELKPSGTLYQYHTESQQFKDMADKELSSEQANALVKQHPKIIQIIGEDRFLKSHLQILGLSHFSPKNLANLSPHQIADSVHSQADIQLVPIEMQKSKRFIELMIGGNAESITWMNPEFYSGMLPNLIKFQPKSFRHLPPELQNEELLNIVLERSPGWKDIQVNVPEQWMSPKIYQAMWNKRITSDKELHFEDVPLEYRSNIVMINSLSRFPEDIEEFANLLDSDTALKIAKKNVAAVDYLPEEYLDDDMAAIINEHIRSNPRDSVRFLRFPSKYWTEEAVQIFVNTPSVKFSFEKIPERLRTPEKTTAYVAYHSETLDTVPTQYLTDDVLASAILKRNNLLSELDPALLTDNVFDTLVHTDYVRGNSWQMMQLYELMPSNLKRPNVRKSFMTANAVPINEMPHNAITENALVRRAGEHPEETNKIPQAFWTPDLAIKLVGRRVETLPEIPESMWTEPFLWQALESLKSDPREKYIPNMELIQEKIINSPRSLWSSRVYADAIAIDLISADDVPANMQDDTVIGVMLGKNPSLITELPPERINSTSLSKAVEIDLGILQKIPADQMTEEIAFAAVNTWSKPKYIGSYASRNNEKILLAIPRKFWSKRVYQAAVGYVIDLKDVPSRYRDENMISDAITRDSNNIKYLKDPAKWIQKRPGTIDSTRLDQLGVIKVKKNYINARDLPNKTTFASGYKVGMVNIGAVNRKYYLLDPKDKFVLYLYTESKRGNKIAKIPPVKDLEKYQTPLLELAQFYLGDATSADLNEIGIYSQRARGSYQWFLEKDAPREKNGELEWSKVDHGDGMYYTAWFNNKQILKVFRETSYSGFGHHRTDVQVEIFNKAVALAHARDIKDYDQGRHIFFDTNASEWPSLGLVVASGTVHNVGKKLIGKMGDLSVKRDQMFVGIFSPTEMIAYGRINASGTIGQIKKLEHRINDDIMRAAFLSISRYLQKNRSVTGIRLDPTGKPVKPKSPA